MNPEDLFSPEVKPELTETKDAAESKDKLYDEVDNLDRQRQEELEPAIEEQEKGPWQVFQDRARQLSEVEVEGELEAFADDPQSSFEYALAPPTGVLDTLIGTYNMAMPGNGMDIPHLPKGS